MKLLSITILSKSVHGQFLGRTVVIVYSLQRDSSEESSILTELKHCSGGQACDVRLACHWRFLLCAGFLLLWLWPCSVCVGPAEVHLTLIQGMQVEEVTCVIFWLSRFMMYFFSLFFCTV